ncbi:MAG: hypothetical protein U1D55_18535 [Phycisphaerae bacterium]
MTFSEAVRSIDASTARAFVTAARHVIDALLIDAGRVRQTQPPGSRDYQAADLAREAPGGGWISDDELRGACQRMSEAMAAEKWTEGLVFAVQALSMLGAI